MKVVKHEDAVAIYIDGMEDVEPARQAAQRALTEKRCRVSALCMTLDEFGRGSYMLAATITPNLAVRSAQGYRANKRPDTAARDLSQAVRQVLAAPV